jgi:proteasome lid subunit RPN8/RPN11
MAVTLNAAVLASIRDHGRDTYPNECCGALLGRDGVVVETFALPNTTEEGPRRRFLVRPSDYRAGHRRRARSARLLSLASRSSRAPVAVRPRSRVAVVLLHHRFGE